MLRESHRLGIEVATCKSQVQRPAEPPPPRNTHCITERIEYKLLSLTYKVLTTTQPPYLHKLISTQRPRSTRSSSVVTLARPPSSSLNYVTDRSFRYASPCLWNQLPLSLRKPHSGTSSSISYSPIPSPITSSSSDSPLCTSIITLSLPA